MEENEKKESELDVNVAPVTKKEKVKVDPNKYNNPYGTPKKER